MNLHENDGIEHRRHPGFDVEKTEASIHELELQLKRGEISCERYLDKKAAPVSIFLKATTRSTRRRKRSTSPTTTELRTRCAAAPPAPTEAA